jgi:hypothetical protein
VVAVQGLGAAQFVAALLEGRRNGSWEPLVADLGETRRGGGHADAALAELPDRSGQLGVVLVSCALTVAVTRFFLGSLAIRRSATRHSTWPTLYGADWYCSLPASWPE